MPCLADTPRRTTFVLLVFVTLAVILQAQTPATNQASPPPLPATATADLRDEARDKALPNFHQVGDRLFRGAQPRSGGIGKLEALGINTIINLRDTDERARAEERAARAAGMRHLNIPLKRLGSPMNKEITRILAIINAPQNGKVFVHCARGADRTGTVIAIYRITHDKWTSEQAQQEANSYGMRFWQCGMKHYIHNYPLRHRT